MKDNVEVDCNTVIGTEGFLFSKNGDNVVRITHKSKVVIDDNVSIGSLCMIQKGTLNITEIGRYVKIDSLCYIGAGSKVKAYSSIAGQTGIAEFVRIGENTTIGGQVGIWLGSNIGDNVFIGGKSGIFSKIENNSRVIGSPAIEINKWKKIQVLLKKLPEIWSKLKEVKT